MAHKWSQLTKSRFALGQAAASLRRPLLLVGGALVALNWAQALSGFGGAEASDFFSRWVYDAVFVVAALVCFSWAIAHRRGRVASIALGAGLLAFIVGSVIYSLAPNLDAVPVPSISDPFWLAIYPCAYVTLLGLVHNRAGATLLATRLDGLASGLAVAAVLACVSLPAAISAASHAPLLEQATNLAYPIGDLILLGGVVSAVALTGWRLDRVWIMLAAAILAWVAADLIFLNDPAPLLGLTADALVLTGAIGMAAALTSRGSTERARPSSGTRGLFLPIGFGVVALGVLGLGAPLSLNPLALGLAAGALAFVLARMVLALRENHALLGESRIEATTDSLTGLPNRRKLTLDLERALDTGAAHTLVMLDLNGFKTYNDSYGHGAGDALLSRLGTALGAAVRDRGEAYRMGGDEFCVLAAGAAEMEELSRYSAEALATSGHGFLITAAHGAVALPAEAKEATAALDLADARMYGNKFSGRQPASSQSAGVLAAVLEERAPTLAHHVRTVRDLASATAERLGMIGDELAALRYGAALHDIGKMAIPEAILTKPGSLSADEWQLIKQHSLIGERIIAAAPALEQSAALVRAHHERVDGGGYPDGLAGTEIPLGARIIFVADSFDAMTSKRPYGPTLSTAEALAELRRCAGSQFDAAVVTEFEQVVTAAERPAEPALDRRSNSGMGRLSNPSLIR